MWNNLILDFTHVYPETMEENMKNIKRIDCSDIPECNLYCSPEAELELKRRIEPYGVSGIHYLDSGNYHYVTKIMLDMIKQPFGLVVWDNHTDMQEPQMEGFTSCGGWLRDTLVTNQQLRQVILIGPDDASLMLDKAESCQQLRTFSTEQLEKGLMAEELISVIEDLPLYLSIDKDVLRKEDARTNWNQGEMTADTLLEQLEAILKQRKIIGADICGEYPQTMPFHEYLEAQHINYLINHKIYTTINAYQSIN